MVTGVSETEALHRGTQNANGCRSWRLLGQLLESLKDYSSFSNFPLKEGNASSFYLCIVFNYKSEDLVILLLGSLYMDSDAFII